MSADVQLRPGETDVGAMLAAVDASPLPVAVIELPDKVVRAISPSALEVIGNDRSVIGHTVEELAADEPTGAFDLLRSGRLAGYETTRVFVGADGERPVRVWVRALTDESPVRLALTVLSRTDELQAGLRTLDPQALAEGAVIGTADKLLVVDRISADVERLLGYRPDEVLQTPLLRYVDGEQAGALLLAIAEATTSRRGTGVLSTARHADGRPVPVAIMIVPLSPAPSFAFALSQADAGGQDEGASRQLLQRVAQIVDCTEMSRDIAQRCRPVPGLERLTTRELHIVGRLLTGDRVPAIAASLYLSQSTVRNHLSSVFAKLRVSSQQQLISLLRDDAAEGRRRSEEEGRSA